jgi:hypothetical protein
MSNVLLSAMSDNEMSSNTGEWAFSRLSKALLPLVSVPSLTDPCLSHNERSVIYGICSFPFARL